MGKKELFVCIQLFWMCDKSVVCWRGRNRTPLALQDSDTASGTKSILCEVYGKPVSLQILFFQKVKPGVCFSQFCTFSLLWHFSSVLL